MIRPDLAEFERALMAANGAIHARSMAKAIRSRRTSVLGKTASDYERAARRLERDVRIVARRAEREAL